MPVCDTRLVPALITWWRRDLATLAPSADPGVVLEVGADLLHRWCEPHRHYHTTSHLVEVFWALEELEEVEEVAPRPGTVGRLAAWFHDAVYAVDGTAAGEAASAALAREVLPGLGVGPADVASVVGLVEDTASHDVGERVGLRAAFHDADLWILCAEPVRFDGYCEQVRREYAHVPDPAYAAGRRAVLAPLIERDHVYATEHAREQWEPQARENLARELARLSARLG